MIMFNIGATELLVILGIALVVFGPGKLPELGQTLGKAIREFKSAVNNIDDDIKREVGDLKQEVQDVKDAVDVSATLQDIQNEIKEAVKIDLSTDAPKDAVAEAVPEPVAEQSPEPTAEPAAEQASEPAAEQA